MAATSDWVEVGHRCWVRRYPEWDVNVGVVAGSSGVLLIDTRGTLRQGHELREDIRRLDRGRVRWVANTHLHFDHVFGNAAFVSDVGDAVYAHENAAAGILVHAERIKEQAREGADERPDADHGELTTQVLQDLIETPVLVPHRTFARQRQIDLGDREVELTWFGHGHTDGDVVASVVGGEVVYAGDLVEESADPSFGSDCFPIDWPVTLSAVLAILGRTTTVVPGHGAPVDLGFVEKQLLDLTNVAETIRELFRARLPLEGALAHRTWPYPREWLANAVRRGYAQLGLASLQGSPQKSRGAFS